MKWVIRCEDVGCINVFWGAHGWTSRPLATIFSNEAMRQMTRPDGGVWMAVL